MQLPPMRFKCGFVISIVKGCQQPARAWKAYCLPPAIGTDRDIAIMLRFEFLLTSRSGCANDRFQERPMSRVMTVMGAEQL